MYSMSRIYVTWDRAMTGRDPDYEKLYKQMLPISTDKSLNKALDFWWRFSAVTFGCLNGFSPATQRKDYLGKLSESKKFGERALKIAPKHFAANLILGKVMQEMACLDNDTKRRTSQLSSLVKHLKEAQAQQPDNWQVCLLEAQANLHLYKLTPAWKSASTLKTEPPPPPASPIPTYSLLPLSVIEVKLRRILYYAPHNLELFKALVDALQLQGRASEAACIAMYASKLEQANAKEMYLGTCLAKFKPEKSETKKRPAKEKSNKKATKR